MVIETSALDLWNLFVVSIFGGFWMAVVGIVILLFIIMGVLGRISIYSATWICIMFLFAMTLGYGYLILNSITTLALLIGLFFSWRNYFAG